MKKVLISIITIASIFLVACPQNIQQLMSDMVYCQAAETHLANMCKISPAQDAYCCQVVAPTKKGLSFSQFCRDTESNGIFLNAKCLSKITNCSQIDLCTGTRK